MKTARIALMALLAGACGAEVAEDRIATFGTPYGPARLHYEIESDVAVVEGDILVPLPDFGTTTSALTGPGGVRAAFNQRWPSGVVPYTIDGDVPNQARITDAVDHWNTNSRMQIVPWDPLVHGPDRIRFEQVSGVCRSYAGRIGGEQAIEIGDDCGVGEIIHELGHAMGLWHEHTRAGRDAHIAIQWANIQPGKEHNFERLTLDEPGVGKAYDVGSIMHYGSYDFSANGLPTITLLDGVTTFDANRSAVTAGDACAVNEFNGMLRCE